MTRAQIYGRWLLAACGTPQLPQHRVERLILALRDHQLGGVQHDAFAAMQFVTGAKVWVAAQFFLAPIRRCGFFA
jgi:hypothetical protein